LNVSLDLQESKSRAFLSAVEEASCSGGAAHAGGSCMVVKEFAAKVQMGSPTVPRAINRRDNRPQIRSLGSCDRRD
jgi:hypothetical protein